MTTGDADRAPHDALRHQLVRSLWLVAAAMAVHELEEWNVASWGARNFTNHSGISNGAIQLGLLVITALFAAWTVLFGEYAPGVASAMLLVVPAAAVAQRHSLTASRLLVAPLLVCAVLWGVSIVQIVQAGRVMQPFQLVIHELCMELATSLGLPPR